jgi:hypothetical protein
MEGKQVGEELPDRVVKRDTKAGGVKDTLVVKVPTPPTALSEGDEVPLPPLIPPSLLPLGHPEAVANPQELVLGVLAALGDSGAGVREDAPTPSEGEGGGEGVGVGVRTSTWRVGWDMGAPR